MVGNSRISKKKLALFREVSGQQSGVELVSFHQPCFPISFLIQPSNLNVVNPSLLAFYCLYNATSVMYLLPSVLLLCFLKLFIGNIHQHSIKLFASYQACLSYCVLPIRIPMMSHHCQDCATFSGLRKNTMLF